MKLAFPSTVPNLYASQRPLCFPIYSVFNLKIRHCPYIIVRYLCWQCTLSYTYTYIIWGHSIFNFSTITEGQGASMFKFINFISELITVSMRHIFTSLLKWFRREDITKINYGPIRKDDFNTQGYYIPCVLNNDRYLPTYLTIDIEEHVGI